MKRIIWKKNRVISIEVRTGLFVLAQMDINPYLIFYNVFQCNNDMYSIDLEKVSVLFYTAVTKQFLHNNNITIRNDVKPLLDYSPPIYWIKKDILGHRNITFWAGTQNEITISSLGQGGGQLLKKDKQEVEIVMDNIPFTDEKVINSFELTNVRTYPELCERLYLCYKFGKNIDPLKNITFNQDITIDYMMYLRILNGSIDKEEWISLPIN